MKNKIESMRQVRGGWGHFLAFFSVFCWSSLYVSVKFCLDYFNPLELLFLQFVLGFSFLFILKPKFLKLPIKEEIRIALAGLCGITLYNLFLNLAMEQTSAFNVSVIIALAPLMTGILVFVLRLEKVYLNFFLGFILSIIGIIVLNIQDFELKFHILGDSFALLSAFGWAIYAMLIVKIMQKTQSPIIITRKILFYGILFMLPSFAFLDFAPKLEMLLEPKVAFNIAFLSSFASGLCFLMWNRATQLIGAIKTNIYVYLTPLITMIVSNIALQDPIHFFQFLGMLLILLGVFIAEHKKSINCKH